MQIFQTNSSTRWNRFKWLTCFVLLAVIVSVTVLIVALQQVYTPALPRLNADTIYTQVDERALVIMKKSGVPIMAFPNILLFQFIIPAFAPAADFFMLISLLTGNAGHILLYYGLFILVDAAVSVLAFHYEKEKKVRLLWLLPQRLIYRWLMLAVLFKAFLKAIKGELQGWGILKRTGQPANGRRASQRCNGEIRKPVKGGYGQAVAIDHQGGKEERNEIIR